MNQFIMVTLLILHTVITVQVKTRDDPEFNETSNKELYSITQETKAPQRYTNTELPVPTPIELPVTSTETPVTIASNHLITTKTEKSVLTVTDQILTKASKRLAVTSTSLTAIEKQPKMTTKIEPSVNITVESPVKTRKSPIIITEETIVTTTMKSVVIIEDQHVTLNEESSLVNIIEKQSVTNATSTKLPVLLFFERNNETLQRTDSQVTTRKPLVTATAEEQEITTEEFNPCLEDDPKMPDFSAPGRRISETKCKEYLWNVEQRKNLTQKYYDCQRYETSKYGIKYAVAGGRSAFHGEFPHMAAIGWKSTTRSWEFKCGSTLISPNFVLTAAHCTKVSSRDTTVLETDPKIVRLGVTDIETAAYFPPIDHSITRIIVHPQYKAPKQYNDIALMELNSDVEFYTKIHPACLWTNFDTSDLGIKASVTGWGVLKSAPIPKSSSPVLQVGIVDIIDSQLCDDLLRPSCNRKQCGIQDHQICAGILAGGVDACQGDSGGPLQVMIPLPVETIETMYYVIGVTSYGIGCALPDSPGVYTRVSSFIDWIEENVWPQSK